MGNQPFNNHIRGVCKDKLMKLILTILSIFACTAIAAQYPPGAITVRAKLDVKVGTGIWDYYNPNGVPAWKGVKGYDEKLIPAGGYPVQREKNLLGIQGYIVFLEKEDGVMERIDMLDSKKKRIKGFLMSFRPYNY